MWQKYLQLGIVHFMIFPEIIRGHGPIVETAKRIAGDPFFEVLEVGLVNEKATLAELKRVIEDAHMMVGVGAQPGLLLNKLNLAALDEGGRKRAVAQVKASIDQAYFLGARLVALLDGPDSYPGPERADKAKEQLIKSLKELCAYAGEEARDYLLAISLEVFDRDVDKRSLLGPAPEVAEVAAQVRTEYDNFGVTVDLSHLPLLGESPRQALTPVQEYLVHIHVGNCVLRDKDHPAYGDYHPPFGCPGGENDVDELIEFLQVLFEIGYFDKDLPTGRPVVTFEVKPLPGGDPELVIAGTKRVWSNAWAKL